MSNTSPGQSGQEQSNPLDGLAATAASCWAFEGVRIAPIKVRENAVYSLQAHGQRAVLRIHRMGYHSDEALLSEFAWIEALRQCGIEVPRPIPSRSGRLFELVDFPGVNGPRQVDVLEWMSGQQLGSVEEGLAVASQAIHSTYEAIGALAARIHNQSCAWRLPSHFVRHAWNADGLIGESPFWGRFWELEALSSEQRALFRAVRVRLRRDLASFGMSHDRYGLIHADLVPENVLVDDDRLRVIDFDDSGFGWYLFEIATSLYFIRREKLYEIARDALLMGYRRQRDLPEEHLWHLPMFLAARGTTYLGWLHTRQGEAAARELTPHLIDLAVAAAHEYLAT